MIDEKTTRLQLPLPHKDNLLSEDVERLRAALTLIDEGLATESDARSALSAEMEDGLAGNAAAAAKAQDTADAAAEAVADWTSGKSGIMTRLETLESAEACLPLSGGTVSGDVSVTGSLTAGDIYNAVWNDYAEFFPRATCGEGCAETVPGDIIAFDAEASAREGRDVYRAAREGDICLAGVHSDSFGHLVGGEIPPEGKDFFAWNIGKFIPVGLVGRVWCRMANAEELDASAPGCRVAPSVEPGAGRLWREGDDPRAVVGFIVRLSDAEHPGRVLLALRPI